MKIKIGIILACLAMFAGVVAYKAITHRKLVRAEMYSEYIGLSVEIHCTAHLLRPPTIWCGILQGETKTRVEIIRYDTGNQHWIGKSAIIKITPLK